MDSFSQHQPPAQVPLEDIRKQILQQQADLTAKGIKLSGRVLHICHYLPVIPSLARSTPKGNLPSPPHTPPTKPAAVGDLTIQAEDGPTPLPKADDPTASSQWSLSVRSGHNAMISGIRSLEAPSEQLIIGWTGDIQNIHQPDATVPLSNVSEEDRLALEKSLETYQPREADPDDERKTTYIPVWIGEKEAHGHYEGYCKESTFFVQPPTPRFSPSVDRRSSPDLTNSIVALVPLPLVAGRRD
jgi:trehalose 6-phosphate synthase/phosphatase